jgi:hypothetical protein
MNSVADVERHRLRENEVKIHVIAIQKPLLKKRGGLVRYIQVRKDRVVFCVYCAHKTGGREN